ncbi:hypothetical protein IU500_06890 [Nocardia terpenica]|uniref:hypothetical protein n=1 Tax=Nocardia terpenica TaxID=455432 RepID=UPI001893A928|nr:hypothetical protein [Nocardia terpenica]MBF6060502.1 hypothetical protein [Nocardia terpenica]MBF6103762.1 hypothetical protein [Nocardia terpenica]MBF6111864.1 hypothetical protein [Nocardia terpenica]MBF6117983.1 hypothetical protein [Nocardia terpenica]MBF6155291.1 hypothetical protein [Nocardia terpenica]
MALSPQFVNAFGEALVDLLEAKVALLITGATGGLIDLRGWASQLRADADKAIAQATAAQTAVASKPGISQVPIPSTLWGSFGNDEDATFPRSQLSFGAAGNTASASGGSTGAHSHALNIVPDYQPAGHGSNYLEIGYIRTTRDRTYSQVGFITGSSATWAGITAAYIGVYRVDPATGNLTLVNPDSAARNLAGEITTQNTEQRFDLATTLNAKQNDIWAVGVLQVTNLLQTCASIMQITLTDLIPPPGTGFPRKNYCYAGPYGSIPASIPEPDLKYDQSTKLPFYVLR